MLNFTLHASLALAAKTLVDRHGLSKAIVNKSLFRMAIVNTVIFLVSLNVAGCYALWDAHFASVLVRPESLIYFFLEGCPLSFTKPFAIVKLHFCN